MISQLLHPKRIAVIGASTHKDKLGRVIYDNIKKTFPGKVFPINVSGGRIGSQKIFRSLQEVRPPIDVAIIVVPAPYVVPVLEACGKKHIRFAVIISAGFSEGGAEGKAREEELLRVARKWRIRILGPNCLGFLSPGSKLNASFAEGLPQQGHVAVISQSGAMAVAINDWATSTGLGFSALVSLGNKSDLSEQEFIEYFGKDESTRIIILYLESLKGGRSLLRTIQRVSKKTPVVILKPGKSTAAQHAVQSHTGAIAGSYAVEQAMLTSAGAIVVQSLQELFLFTKIFEHAWAMRNNRIAVVTNAGGPGIIATDAVIDAGLRMAKLGSKVQQTLKKALPATASVHNPVDVVGDAPARRYKDALEIVMQDPQVDAVLLLLTHQYVTETETIARYASDAQQRNPGVPLVACFIGGDSVQRGRHILSKKKIPHFAYPHQAVAALAAVWERSKANTRKFSFTRDTKTMIGETRPILGTDAEKIVKGTIPFIVRSVLAQSIRQTARAAKRLGYPVAVKVIHKSAIHKTDKQYVAVNIHSESELVKRAKPWFSRLSFNSNEGVLVQQYVPGSLEIFIGAKRDPELGAYVIFGLGGIFVKALDIHDIAPLPISNSQAKHFIEHGSLARLLRSSRGAHIPVNDLVQVLVGVSTLFAARPDVEELDLNPVIVSSRGVSLVDIRLVLRS